MALFSAGLKLDRPLTLRDWGSVARLLAARDADHDRRSSRCSAPGCSGCSAAAALLLGAALAPTDPVLAGDIGVGPPGDEDEHEPNFALTAEAGLNDGLACAVRARRRLRGRAGRRRLGRRVARRRRRLRDRRRASRSARRSASPRPGASSGCAAATCCSPTFDGYHAIATALVIYGLAEVPAATASSPCSPAASRSAATSTTTSSTRRVHEGAERLEKLLELAVILLLGSMLTIAGLGAPGWEGWLLAVLLLVVVRPARRACSALVGSRMDHPGEKAFVAWFGVRGVGTLYYVAVDRRRRRARRRRAGRSSCGRAIAACCSRSSSTASPPGRRCGGCWPGAGGRERATPRPAPRAARLLALVEQVEHRRLERRLVDRQLARLAAAPPTRSSAGRIVSPRLVGVEHARVDVGGAADRRACCRGSARPPRSRG